MIPFLETLLPYTMTVLDLQTLQVMTFVNFTIATIAAIFIWYSNRPVAGLASVARGFVAICCGFGFAVFPYAFLGRAATWFGSAAIVGGLYLILHGALEFRGFRRLPVSLAALSAAPFLIAHTYFLYVQDQRPVRVAVLFPLMATICFAAAWVMMHQIPRENRLVYGIISLGLSLYGTVLLIRTVISFFPELSDPAGATRLNVLCLVALNVSIISGLFGLSTATNWKLREQIQKLALCDPLTGLPNRRAFDECLDQMRTRSLATGSPAALVYVDLDQFKSINDRFGHDEGDTVLKRVAERLTTAVHHGECLARIGGDEFAVLSQRFNTRSAALSLLEDLHRSIEAPLTVAGTSLTITISCGLAFYPDDVRDTADLIREADTRMYRVKRGVPARR